MRTRIDIEPGTVFSSYGERQKLYLDAARGELIANTEIWEGDVLQMRVNGLGCKGEEVDTSRPVIAFFGDSTTMGHCFSPDSWPAHVEIDGYEILNAAVEGSAVERVAERYERIRERVDLACAVVYVGWHNLVYNRNDPEYWDEQLRRFLGGHPTAYCTVATCMTEDFRVRGIEPLLQRGSIRSVAGASEAASLDAGYFNFWMDLDPADFLEPLLDAVERYNDFLRRFAEWHGALLVDLHGALLPPSYEDAPLDFYDVCHLRPRAYPKVARVVTETLRAALTHPVEAA